MSAALPRARGFRFPYVQLDAVTGEVAGSTSYYEVNPALRAIVLLSAAFNFAFTGPVSVGHPYLAKERFGGGPAEFGLMVGPPIPEMTGLWVDREAPSEASARFCANCSRSYGNSAKR